MRKEELKVDTGADSITIHHRGPDAVSHFCKVCGSMLYLVVRNGECAHVQMGTLIDEPGIRPLFHMYVGSKAVWHSIADTLPRFPTSATTRHMKSCRAD